MRVGDGLRVTCERLAGDLQQDRERVASDWRARRADCIERQSDDEGVERRCASPTADSSIILVLLYYL